MTLLESLQQAVRSAASSNPFAEEAPVCILWTDAERLFEPILPALWAAMPELFILGDYAPDERRGPAIWLRYLLDGSRIEGTAPPVFYLPGISRAQLRPEENCPFLLAPLCELTFRGKAWSHEYKDWTPAALLMALGIEVHTDAPAKAALQRALPRLVKLDMDELKAQAPLTAAVLNDLLNPDPVEALLGWMNDPKAWKAAHTAAEWTAFKETCKTKYGFNPGKDGELQAAELLGACGGAWESVWRTFKRSPQHFAGVVDLLSRARPKRDHLFFKKSSWPQVNTEEETKLRQSLLALADVTANEARGHVAELEALHGERREWVWNELGQAPLAQALRHLNVLATLAAQPLTGATPQAIAEQWTHSAWQCDAALLDALASVEETGDWEAVKVAARALYRDWLDQSAKHFAQHVTTSPHVGNGFNDPSSYSAPAAGICYMFADGLRYDVAQKLMMELEKSGLHCDCRWQFGPVPGVTSAAKPAATPLSNFDFRGANNLETEFADGRKVTADSLRNELKKAGFQILMGSDAGQPRQGPAWTESGAFDSIGHSEGAGLARRIGGEVRNLAARIRTLLNAGWDEVRLTTDHGWMLLPGNLDKAHLPEHLTEVRKGRCARLKPGAVTEFKTVGWFWDGSVNMAVAPGARCFEEGKEYEHGGLSVQECVLPLVTVRSSTVKTPALRLDSSTWRGFRCAVSLTGQEGLPMDGYKVDMRTKAADPTSTICNGGKAVTGDSVALVVEDEHRGAAAHVVLLDATGAVLDKVTTTVPDD